MVEAQINHSSLGRYKSMAKYALESKKIEK